MQKLDEISPAHDLARLDAAWADDGSFAYVPARRGHSTEWIHTALAQIPAAFNHDHFALLTSGSTGQSKLVIGQKVRADALAKVLHEQQKLEPCDSTILALPLSYCFAFVNQWRWARVHNRGIVITDGFSDPTSLREAFIHAQKAMLCLVGAQIPLLEGVAENARFPGIIRINFAGGRFPQEKLDTIQKIFPAAEIFNNYGCAEAMPRLTLRHGKSETLASRIGAPLPGIRLRATEDARLEFQSPYGAVAFVTEQGFRDVREDDWVPTGDLAEALPDGTWNLLGRAGEVFKRYGEKVALSSILSALREQYAGEIVAYREPDPSGEEGYVLALAPEPTPETRRSLLLLFRERFPRPLWPLRIEAVPSFPLLPNGKPDIHTLKTMSASIIWKQHL